MRFHPALFAVGLGTNGVSGLRGSVFDRVVTALEGALQDAVDSQKRNNDEFKKAECQANELITAAKTAIPVHQENIEKATVRQKELRADNQFLSGEAFELDENVDKMTKELANKQQARNQANLKYIEDKKQFTEAADQLGRAVQVLTEGTANFLQVSSSLSALPKEHLAMVQTAAKSKTGTSGQIIGILTKLKEQMEANLATTEATEKENADMFKKYKDRTDKQILSESAQSQSNKNRIADNQLELSAVQARLKSNTNDLASMKTQLETQTEILSQHTEFHKQLTAESEGLKKAIKGAITLLTSNDAKNTMDKASDHIVEADAPGFVQLAAKPNNFLSQRIVVVKQHVQSEKAAGDYAWNSIFTALDDMTEAVNASQDEADEKFATCEMQLKQHHAEEKKLKGQKLKSENDINAANTLIDEMDEDIKNAKQEIADSTKEIKDTTNDIRDAEETAAKETKEAQDASGLFKQAIAFLKQYESNKGMEAPKSDPKEDTVIKYETNTMAAGTEKVVGIIEQVETDMMKEVEDMNNQTKQNIVQWQTAIGEAKDRIKTSKDTIATSTTKKAEAQADLAGAEVFFKAAEEGLATEAAWWGPAPGNKLPAPGEECISFLGKQSLSESEGRNDDYTATDKATGTGEYHTKSKTNTDELAALTEMKNVIEGIRNEYLVVQPAGSVVGSG